MSFYYKELLEKLNVSIEESLLLNLLKEAKLTGLQKPQDKNQAVQEFLQKKIPEEFFEKGYLVMHPGSDRKNKEWPIEEWKKLVKKCEKDFFLVFTGKGKREKELVAKILEGSCNAISLVDDLSWKEFVDAIKEARALISIDTASIHIARGFSIPTYALFCGIEDPCYFAPPEAKVFFQRISCVPCYRKEGCESMSCLKEITAEKIYIEIMQDLESEKVIR
jgi:ADP-heptose:LPS heptosyltransferase